MRALSPVRSAELKRPGRAWRWPLTLAGLFLAALALRWGYVLELADLATFRHLVVDAARYDELARSILTRGFVPDEPFSQAPLYPYFLASVYSLFGVSYTAVRLIQGVLGAATVVLLTLATGRAFGRPAGLVAGLLATFYGPFVFYAGLLWKPTLTLFLLSAVLFLLAGEPGRRAGMGRLLAAGVLLGAAGLLRENVLVLAPFLAALLWLEPRVLTGEGRSWKRPSWLAVGVVLALLPVVLLNVRASGEWMLTSAQGGMNFYIGNGPEATGTYVPFSDDSQDPEQLLADSRRVAARLLSERTGEPMTPEELTPARSSRVLWTETLRSMAADPLGWLRMTARKARLFWNAYEIPDAEDLVVNRELSAVLALAPVSFGWLAPLALLGFVPAFRRAPREAWLVAAGTLGVFVSVMLFFVLGRYRLPVTPFLLPPAGLAVAWLGSLVKGVLEDRRRFKAPAAAGAALAVLLLWVHWPVFDQDARRQHTAALWFNLGSAAQQLAGEAYDELPQNPEALGRGLARSGQAVGFLRRAVEASPGFAVARIELGVALHRQAIFLQLAGQRTEALERYGESIEGLETGLALAEATGAPQDLTAQAEAVLEVVRRNRARLAVRWEETLPP